MQSPPTNDSIIADGRDARPAQPPWLNDSVIAVREASALVDVGLETTSHWLKTARLMGIPLHRKLESRRLLNGHQVYVLGILGALHAAGIACGADLLRAVHTVTHEGGVPRLPSLFEVAQLNEGDAGGRPAAIIQVSLSSIWLELEPKLAAMMAG